MSHIETAIKMTLDRWYGSVVSLDKLLSVLTDEQLLKETAPLNLSVVSSQQPLLRGISKKMY